jgi:hypothetical protein
MKSICVWAVTACLLTSLATRCQPPATRHQRQPDKTKLFSQLPAKISCSTSSLQTIFTAAVNSPVCMIVSPLLTVEGLVIAKAAISPEQMSINIRCSNFRDALLNLSRIKEKDGSYSYIGRMVSRHHADVLLLWQENGQYAFIRQKQLLSMVE